LNQAKRKRPELQVRSKEWGNSPCEKHLRKDLVKLLHKMVEAEEIRTKKGMSKEWDRLRVLELLNTHLVCSSMGFVGIGTGQGGGGDIFPSPTTIPDRAEN